MNGTTDPTGDGLSVNEAAERLGISPDAVRARIRRGTLRAEKHENAWTVYLSDTTRHNTDRHTMAPGIRHDRTDPTVVQGTDLAPLVDLLADAMQRNADVMKQNADLAAAAMWQTRAAHLEDQLKQLSAGSRDSHEAFIGPESVDHTTQGPESRGYRGGPRYGHPGNAAAVAAGARLAPAR